MPRNRRGTIPAPIAIKSHVDALNYMMKKDNFVMAEAIAVHLMQMNLLDRLEEKERNEGRKLSADEVNAFVDNIYSAMQLDNFKFDSVTRLKVWEKEVEQEIYVDRIGELLGNHRSLFRRIVLNRGAWQGVYGNILTFFAGVVLTILVWMGNDFQKTKDLGVSAINLYEKCFPGAQHNNAQANDTGTVGR